MGSPAQLGIFLTFIGAYALGFWPAEAGSIGIIGGADGLDPALKAKSRMMLRLSSMTLPHAFARVLLTEQIYRAWSILANHPYHRV